MKSSYDSKIGYVCFNIGTLYLLCIRNTNNRHKNDREFHWQRKAHTSYGQHRFPSKMTIPFPITNNLRINTFQIYFINPFTLVFKITA